MKKAKVLGLLLALAVMLGALPMAAAAAEAEPLYRKDAVVYLWNDAGCPEPTLTENPFADVDAGADYYKAVLWAAGTGLTDGTGGGRFSPDAPVDRAQMAAFLWKQAGKPASTASIPFTDVVQNAWYAPAVAWALDAGLLDAGAGAFAPNAPVSLAELKDALARGADPFLAQLCGSYVELFPEMKREEYLPIWNETLLPYCQSEEELGLYYSMFTDRFMSELYGPAAEEAYAADPESAMFNCFFLQEVARFDVSGNTIRGTDAGGKEIFRHSYHYVEDRPVTYFGMELPSVMHIYESDGAAADGFRFFAFSDDTPAETYHLEFRYGPSLEGLTNYTEGAYAYWLASAIAADCDTQTMTDCITLFVTENLGEAEEQDIFSAIAGAEGTTYVSLFDRIISDRWTPVWADYVAAIVGEDAAADMTAGLQSAITSDLYGEAAVAAFAGGGYAFDCDFINGAQSITFKDDTVTILKTDGASETHTYEYLGQYNVGDGETMQYQGMEISMAFPVDVYKSTDEAGEFNYFLLREDTMEETYHIEFRYGRDLDELQGYLVGPYAYWLAAGIDESADEDTIRRVIALFCLENMDYSAHTEAALKQIEALGFVGAWKADLSAFGESYASVDLRMTIDENGHGVTTMDGAQTADFEAYAVDDGAKGDGDGLYVAYSNLEYEAEAAPFTMTVNDAGRTVLTLTADDGTISWVKCD